MLQATDTTQRTRPVEDLDRRRTLTEERTLFARYARYRAPRDRELLVRRFLPLARQVARRYHRPSEPFDDLMQVASLGLVKAIDRYDPERGLAFTSFAVPTIAGEIKRHFRDHTWAVRVPRGLQELVLRIERATSEMTREMGRAPTVHELAHAVGAGDEEVLEALQAASTAHRASSLDQTRGGEDDDDGATIGDALGTWDDGFRRAEDRATLSAVIGVLDEREREILRLRFQEDLTQREIGDLIGVSQMHVSRLLRRALAKLEAAR
jgi:RNA polymerase sigma-B factor